MQKSSESIRAAVTEAAKGRAVTPGVETSGNNEHEEGSDSGVIENTSCNASSTGIWPTNMFISQYSMLGTNGLAGLQKALEVEENVLYFCFYFFFFVSFFSYFLILAC